MRCVIRPPRVVQRMKHVGQSRALRVAGRGSSSSPDRLPGGKLFIVARYGAAAHRIVVLSRTPAVVQTNRHLEQDPSGASKV